MSKSILDMIDKYIKHSVRNVGKFIIIPEGFTILEISDVDYDYTEENVKSYLCHVVRSTEAKWRDRYLHTILVEDMEKNNWIMVEFWKDVDMESIKILYV